MMHDYRDTCQRLLQVSLKHQNRLEEQDSGKLSKLEFRIKAKASGF